MLKSVAFILTATTALACSVDYSIWIPRSNTADPLYRFVKGDKAGYIDRSGRVVIPPTLEVYGNAGSEFHDGLLEVAVSSGRYVDRTGQIVLNPGLYRGWDFSEGLAAAMPKGQNLWGYIDRSGKFVISPRFETAAGGYITSFADGFALIEVRDKFGFIDRTGEFAIKPQFLHAESFSDGMARVIIDGPCIYVPDGPCPGIRVIGGADPAKGALCKFSFIDRSGKVISSDRYDNARDFSEGLAPVQIGKLWGFIDKQGSLVVAPQFEDAQPFRSGLSTIKAAGLYGYVDKTGSLRVTPQYSQAEDFSEGLAVVGDGSGRYWYIDQSGKRAIRDDFAIASPFFNGLAHVKLLPRETKDERLLYTDPYHGRFAYIDVSGQRIFTYTR